MRLIFNITILLAGFFAIFNLFPTDNESTFTAASGSGPAVSGDIPAAPVINRNTAGGKLFMENCSRCHSANLTQDMTGPALFGIEERVEDRKLLAAWIKNAGKVLETDDPYFRRLWLEWNKANMDPMPHLSAEEIDAIITELTSESS
ncbi:MAG: cytochrome c [Bacteroidota bacterium]